MHEINNVRPQGLLTSEAFAIEAIGPQVVPEEFFRIRHILAEVFREFDFLLRQYEPDKIVDAGYANL